jgi:hypothetical protein
VASAFWVVLFAGAADEADEAVLELWLDDPHALSTSAPAATAGSSPSR